MQTVHWKPLKRGRQQNQNGSILSCYHLVIYHCCHSACTFIQSNSLAYTVANLVLSGSPVAEFELQLQTQIFFFTCLLFHCFQPFQPKKHYFYKQWSKQSVLKKEIVYIIKSINIINKNISLIIWYMQGLIRFIFLHTSDVFAPPVHINLIQSVQKHGYDLFIYLFHFNQIIIWHP